MGPLLCAQERQPLLPHLAGAAAVRFSGRARRAPLQCSLHRGPGTGGPGTDGAAAPTGADPGSDFGAVRAATRI